jgi:hypothetical protein
MRVEDQLLLFLFLSHVVVTVVQQFHVQTCSALYWSACLRRIPLSLWIFSICYCSGPRKLVASASIRWRDSDGAGFCCRKTFFRVSAPASMFFPVVVVCVSICSLRYTAPWRSF